MRYATPVAVGLIVICCALYAIGTASEAADMRLRLALLYDVTPIQPAIVGDADGTERIVLVGSNFDDVFARGQVWRLVTPMLLHGGFLHLLFNMMWLWRFGQVIEGVKGSGFFIAMVLAISAISCSAQAGWFEAQGDWRPFLGISGVNAGLFGYAWMKHRLQPYEGIHVSDQEVGLMLGMLVLMSFGFLGPQIANAAHWGGLVVGLAIGAAPWAWRKLRRR
jgi:GlpG protein